MSGTFIDYVLSFYANDGVYPLGVTRLQAELATQVYLARLEKRGVEFCGDTVDREAVRDIILEARQGTLPEFAKV
jgi:hypothetical protein